MGWHQLSGPHPEHGERGRYAKAGREGILMLREKKSLLSKAGREIILMMRIRENRSKIKDHTCWSWRWPQQASCQHLLPWIKRNWVWEEIWRKIQTRGGTKSCMGFQKSTLEGNSWWWRRDRQHSWGQYRGTFGPSKSSGWKALNHHQEKKVLTQATSARSLPGTSKIAAIKKLTKRVPRTGNKMCWNGFALYNYASVHTC